MSADTHPQFVNGTIHYTELQFPAEEVPRMVGLETWPSDMPIDEAAEAMDRERRPTKPVFRS